MYLKHLNIWSYCSGRLLICRGWRLSKEMGFWVSGQALRFITPDFLSFLCSWSTEVWASSYTHGVSKQLHTPLTTGSKQFSFHVSLPCSSVPYMCQNKSFLLSVVSCQVFNCYGEKIYVCSCMHLCCVYACMYTYAHTHRHIGTPEDNAHLCMCRYVQVGTSKSTWRQRCLGHRYQPVNSSLTSRSSRRCWNFLEWPGPKPQPWWRPELELV